MTQISMTRIRVTRIRVTRGPPVCTGCPVTDRGTLLLIENLQFWPKKSP